MFVLLLGCTLSSMPPPVPMAKGQSVEVGGAVGAHYSNIDDQTYPDVPMDGLGPYVQGYVAWQRSPLLHFYGQGSVNLHDLYGTGVGVGWRPGRVGERSMVGLDLGGGLNYATVGAYGSWRATDRVWVWATPRLSFPGFATVEPELALGATWLKGPVALSAQLSAVRISELGTGRVMYRGPTGAVAAGFRF